MTKRQAYIIMTLLGLSSPVWCSLARLWSVAGMWRRPPLCWQADG
ncbi:MAG: hypothetical protein ACLU9S_14765 [Oscillospiraceae bacterium]